MWLDRASPLADILQGKTDSNGEIVIYGAHNGDTARAQISGASASTTVSCTAATKASGGAPEKADGDEIQLEDDPFSLRVKLLPSGGSAAWVEVTASVDLVSAPDVELQQMGVGDPVSIDVEWDAGENAWLGDVNLMPDFDLAGVIVVRGTDLSTHTVHRMNSFALTAAGPSEPPRIYSFDGVFELLLAEGSLTEDSVIGVHEIDIGTSQQGDLRRVGNAYEVSVSTGEQVFATPAVVNIRYQGTQTWNLAPTGLQLYRWDSGTDLWVLEGGVSDADFNIVSAEVDGLSVFAVLGSTADIFSDGFETAGTDGWSLVIP